MKNIKIELGARVIPESRRIWLVHAGTKRRLLNDFVVNGKIFIELPDFSISDSNIKNDHLVRQSIKYSRALISAGGYTLNGAPILLNNYNGDPDPDITQSIRIVRHLHEMKDGDLIVVPTKGPYGALLFGEVTGSYNHNDFSRTSRFNFASLPSRRVKWISNTVTKNNLPEAIGKLLSKPPAISEIKRGEVNDKLFSFAYESYISENDAWTLISAPSYDGNDPLALVAPNQLISFAIAAFWASNKKANLTGLTFEQIIERFYSVQDIEDFGVNFNSPGKLGFKTINVNLAIFVTSFIALSCAGFAPAPNDKIELVSAGSGQNNPITETEASINYFTSSVDMGVKNKAVDIAQKSKKDVGLKSDAIVT